jgi:hypothetical protein
VGSDGKDIGPDIQAVNAGEVKIRMRCKRALRILSCDSLD